MARKNFPWASRIEEVRRMMEVDGLAPREVAERLGVDVYNLYDALKRYGIAIDRAISLRAQGERLKRHNALPEVRARRKLIAREVCSRPEVREARRQAQLRAMQRDPQLAAERRARLASPEFVEQRIKGFREARRRRLETWCPAPFHDDYRRLRRVNKLSEEEARNALLPLINRWLKTPEGQLWRVRTGRARLVPNTPMSVPVSTAAGPLISSTLAV